MTVRRRVSSRLSQIKLVITSVISLVLLGSSLIYAHASDYNAPWRDKNKAIIIDAYERNHVDWMKLVENKQIRGFIGKASDGMPSPYSCRGNKTKQIICKKSFKNYFMKQQLYHTRKLLAKNLGLKWGAYHLGRPGNPIGQANHFLQFAKPEADELIALDIEHDNPKKWISLEDAEIFAKHIYKRIGRYPVLYTNHNTAQRIAARKDELPILSRLPLWYARYKSNTIGTFPMGHWESFSMWQFSAGINCNKRRCLYRVKGAPNNIDVNVSNLTIEEFDKAWPFNGLVEKRIEEPETKLPQVWASLDLNRPTQAMQLAILNDDVIAAPKKKLETASAVEQVKPISATAAVMDKAQPLSNALPPSARADVR